MVWRRQKNQHDTRHKDLNAQSGNHDHHLRDRLRAYAIASAGDEDISQFPSGSTTTVARAPIGLLTLYGVIVGAVVGIVVAGAAHLILLIERIIYGTDHRHSIAPIAHSGATPKLLLILVLVGLVTGTAWSLMHWKVTTTVSIPEAMRGKHMPAFSSAASALIQIVSVSAGVPVGRENAPRQLGALIASQFSSNWMVDKRTRRLLVACAAGAGMSASFHLPLAGALFTIEMLLVSASVRAVVTAMTTCVTATAVSGLLGLPRINYTAVQLDEGSLTLLCAVIIGALTGLAGDYFARLAHRASARPVPPQWQWLATTLVMAVVAGCSTFYLGASGNGAYVANEALTARVSLGVAIGVVVLRIALTCVCFWAGSIGGVLTPAFSLGAMLGLALGYCLHALIPAVDPRACALLGAAAFLSTTMAAPLFGMVAAVEFTNQGADGYLAMFAAVVIAVLTVRASQKGQSMLQNRSVRPNKAGRATAGQSPFADDAREAQRH